MPRLLKFVSTLVFFIGIPLLFSSCGNCRDDDCPLDLRQFRLNLVDSLGNICKTPNAEIREHAINLTNEINGSEILFYSFINDQLTVEFGPGSSFILQLNDSIGFTYTSSRDSMVESKCCGTFTPRFSVIEENSSKVVCSTCEEMEIVLPNCL